MNVYVDFDGTIAPADPTDALFDRFADPAWRQIEERWQQGRLASRDCMQAQVEMLRATPAAIDAFLDTVEIDPHFPGFVRLCHRHGLRVAVVSDGLDRIVGPVLERAGLNLPFFANQLEWLGGDRWTLRFPYARPDCRVNMGNCKCGHRRPNATADIMVGDGRSDFCIASRCRLVLSKGALTRHCQTAGLPHRPIGDFADATRLLAAWLRQPTPIEARASAG